MERYELPVHFQIMMTFAECGECQTRFAVVKDHSEGTDGDNCDVDAANNADFCPFCGAALL